MGSEIKKRDVTAVQELVREKKEAVLSRCKENVIGRGTPYSQSRFWYVSLDCLLTTQQRAAPGYPVPRFLSLDPFPLALQHCRNSNVNTLVRRTLKAFGGIRFYTNIADFAHHNLEWLEREGWTEIKRQYEVLARQRDKTPLLSHSAAEKAAGQFVDDHLKGFGPKQARNLWQLLALTRYQIPLDSRVSKWINKNLSFEVDAGRLISASYYESVHSRIAEICYEADVLPCLFDAAAFNYK